MKGSYSYRDNGETEGMTVRKGANRAAIEVKQKG
ncbi:hypothetical protein JOC95_004299 [Bacillus tianshenii]|uniref:Uncharacterized protein n=1 Tax=Sutcliffiella tianshenii TaxID=1463404 RepID=A0ABS2P6W2_9BACI|nr:hypothetical protein [Bacillus tianshenii]